jgi:hypothetical protein
LSVWLQDRHVDLHVGNQASTSPTKIALAKNSGTFHVELYVL